MKTSMILLACGFVTACVTGYNPGYYFNEVQVVNLSGATISNVALRVNESVKTLSCSEVAKFAMCDDRFGKRRYPQQGIDLSWTHADGSRKSVTESPAVPAFFPAAFSLRIVIEIHEDGSVNAFHEQEEPGRDGDFVVGG